MKRFSDVRKIKIIGNTIKKNEVVLEPNTLFLIKNNENYSMNSTQFFIDNNTLDNKTSTTNKQNIISSRTASENIQIPDLSLPLTDMLNIYNIDTYDELLILIQKLILENNTEYTIYRLINIYTRIFFDDLKKSHNTLIKIFNIVFEQYKPSTDILNKFLIKWFENNNKNSFNLNICINLKYFLSSRYERD